MPGDPETGVLQATDCLQQQTHMHRDGQALRACLQTLSFPPHLRRMGGEAGVEHATTPCAPRAPTCKVLHRSGFSEDVPPPHSNSGQGPPQCQQDERQPLGSVGPRREGGPARQGQAQRPRQRSSSWGGCCRALPHVEGSLQQGYCQRADCERQPQAALQEGCKQQQALQAGGMSFEAGPLA